MAVIAESIREQQSPETGLEKVMRIDDRGQEALMWPLDLWQDIRRIKEGIIHKAN